MDIASDTLPPDEGPTEYTQSDYQHAVKRMLELRQENQGLRVTIASQKGEIAALETDLRNIKCERQTLQLALDGVPHSNDLRDSEIQRLKTQLEYARESAIQVAKANANAWEQMNEYLVIRQRDMKALREEKKALRIRAEHPVLFNPPTDLASMGERAIDLSKPTPNETLPSNA